MRTRKISSVIRRQFFSAMAVMTMVEIAHAMSSLVDGAMAARLLGPTELAASGITNPYYSVTAMISGVLMVSCQTMCARSIGSGRLDEANNIFSICCTLGVTLAAVLSVFGILFAGQFAWLLGARGASAELQPYTKSYLTGLFVGTPVNVLVTILIPIVQMDGGAKRATLASCTVTVADVIGDVLFMVVMKMGLLGLGLGTAFSYFAALAVLLPHFWKEDRLFRFRLRGVKWSMAPKVVSVGLPRGATQLCRTVGPILVNSIVLSVAATTGLTALSVQNNLATLLRSPILGVCSAVVLLTGVYAGEQDVNGMKQTIRQAIRYVVLLIGAVAVAVAAASPLIAGFYLPNAPEARRMASRAVCWFALSLPLMAMNVGAGNYLTAIGSKMGAYLINIGNELVSTVFCVFVLGKLFGAGGIWVAFFASQLLTLTVFVHRFDLKEKVKSWSLDPEHPEENIGIRMVLGLSKDVVYTNTMNMNNLLITV